VRIRILVWSALGLAVLAVGGLWTLSLLPKILPKGKPETPLAVAAVGSPEELRRELRPGVNVNGKDPHGFVALDWAARTGQTEAIAELVKAGADPDFQDSGPNGWTPLLHAVHKNQLASVRALLAAGADPNARGENGLTPLMLAAAQGEPEIVAELLAAGANPRLHGPLRWTALEQGVANGHPKVVDALLRKDPGLSLGHGPRAWGIRTLARLTGHSQVLEIVDRREGR
jgi:ankyrin repeat protein